MHFQSQHTSLAPLIVCLSHWNRVPWGQGPGSSWSQKLRGDPAQSRAPVTGWLESVLAGVTCRALRLAPLCLSEVVTEPSFNTFVEPITLKLSYLLTFHSFRCFIDHLLYVASSLGINHRGINLSSQQNLYPRGEVWIGKIENCI